MVKGRIRVPAGVADWAIAAGVAALLLGTGWSGEHPGTGPDLIGYALLAAGGLALAALRRAPLVVLAVTGLCAVGYQAAGFDVLAVFVPGRGLRRGAGRAPCHHGGGVRDHAGRSEPDGTGFPRRARGRGARSTRGVLELAWLIAAFAAGEAVRQAERRADEAERTREETARRRADEERLHIARELHDSLTHQISIIKVQSEVAVHLARRRGERVPHTLLAIQEAGREATRELRATLQALRDDDIAPPRGLDHIPELVERAGSTGLKTTLTIKGQRPDVSTAVGRTAYRIVQESLTNIARHAAAATASVRIDYRPDALAIRIDDDGKATPDTAPTLGLGLLGMPRTRHRSRRPTARRTRGERGFTVQAELPVEQTS